MDLNNYGMVSIKDGYDQLLIDMVVDNSLFVFYKPNKSDIDLLLKNHPEVEENLFLTTSVHPLVLFDEESAILVEVEHFAFFDQYVNSFNHFKKTYGINSEGFDAEMILTLTSNRFAHLIKDLLFNNCTFTKKETRKLNISRYAKQEYSHNKEEFKAILKETLDFKLDSEIEWFNSSDDIINIYRGQTNESSDLEEAISWTTDKNKAVWFSDRFNSGGKVFSAKIKKENILGYISERNESEVIVEFNSLIDVKRED